MRPDLMDIQPIRRIRPHHTLDQVQEFGAIIQFNLLEVVLSKVVPRFTPAKHSNHQCHQSTHSNANRRSSATSKNSNSLSRYDDVRRGLKHGHT